MIVTPKITHVSGSFDTEKAEMVCVSKHKYASVDLCIRQSDGWLLPIGKVVLQNTDRFSDAQATFEDAKALGTEIARRWNECNDKK